MKSLDGFATIRKAFASLILLRFAIDTSESLGIEAAIESIGHLGRATPDPRVNIQNDRGMAKPYQVRQVINAIERMETSE